MSGVEQLKELVCKLPVTKISPNGQGLIPCLCSGRGKVGLVFIASCRERLLLPFFFPLELNLLMMSRVKKEM